MQLVAEVAEVYGNSNLTFSFIHEGRKAYCFISPHAAPLPLLARGTRLALEGEWSSALLLVYAADQVRLVDRAS